MNSRPVSTTAAFVSIVLALQFVASPAVAQESTTKSGTPQPVSTTPVDSSAKQEIEIDAPSASLRNHAELPVHAGPATIELGQQSSQTMEVGTGAGQDPVRSTPQQPQGAAAARIQSATGTAGSKPAGAAIAPAKQRRVRTFLIRFGAVAGVGVAVATVFALSSASPSKPPGSH